MATPSWRHPLPPRPSLLHWPSLIILALLLCFYPVQAFWPSYSRPVANRFDRLILAPASPDVDINLVEGSSTSTTTTPTRPPSSSRSGDGGSFRGKKYPSSPARGSAYDSDHIRAVVTALEKELQEVREVTLAGSHINPDEEDKYLVSGGVADLINMVRSLAEPQRQWLITKSCRLYNWPILDVATVRVAFKALSLQTDITEVGLLLVASMRKYGIYPDAYVVGLAAKMAETQPEWTTVVEALQNLLLEAVARGEKPENTRRHQGYTYALLSAVRRGNGYAAGYLIDALLLVGMVDLTTAKLALRTFIYQKRAKVGIRWVQVVRAVGLQPDGELYLDMIRLYRQLQKPKQALELLDEALSHMDKDDPESINFATRQLTVVLQTCQDTGVCCRG